MFWLQAAACLLAVVATAWAGGCAGRMLFAGRDTAFAAAVGANLAIIVAAEGLSALGALNVPALLATGFTCSALVMRHADYRRLPSLSRLQPVPERPWIGILLLAVVVVACASAVAGPSSELDTMRYHVVNAAAILDHGSLWPLPYAEPGEHTATAPGAASAVEALLMLATHDDRLACLPNIAWLLLLGWAGVVCAVRVGARRDVAVLVMTAAMSLPVVIDRAWHTMMDDSLLAAGIVAALAVWLTARQVGMTWTRLLVIGALLGVSVATKFSGIIDATGLLVVILAVTWRSAGTRAVGRFAAPLMIGIAAIAGPWYLRNWISAGNPLWPSPITLAGHQLFAGTDPAATLPLTPVGAWLVQSPGNVILLLAALAVGGGPLLLAALPGLRRPRTPDQRILLGAGVIAAVGYLATPYTVTVPDIATLGLELRLGWAAPVLLLAWAAAALPWRWALLLAGSSLAHSAAFSVVGSFGPDRLMLGRADVHPWPETLAVGAVAAAVAVAARIGQWRAARWWTAGAAAGWAASLLVFWQEVPNTPILTAIAHRHGSGPVVVVMAERMREVIGQDLDVLPTGFGNGPLGAEQMVEGDAVVRAVTAQDPSLVVVGNDDTDIVPPRWTVPSTWICVAREGSITVYAADARHAAGFGSCGASQMNVDWTGAG